MKTLKYLIMTVASALAICGCSEKDETEKKIEELFYTPINYDLIV